MRLRFVGIEFDRILALPNSFVMQAGAPYIGVESKCEGGNTTLNLSQKRYFNTPELFNQPNDQIWQVPVCARGINGNTAG